MVRINGDGLEGNVPECVSQHVTEAREKLGGEALAPPGPLPTPKQRIMFTLITRAPQATPLQIIAELAGKPSFLLEATSLLREASVR
jgi:hypothetical protein